MGTRTTRRLVRPRLSVAAPILGAAMTILVTPAAAREPIPPAGTGATTTSSADIERRIERDIPVDGSLRVSPTVISTTRSAGNQQTVRLTVKNRSTEPVAMRLVPVSITPTAPGSRTTYRIAAASPPTWLKPAAATLRLAAQETATIPVTITPPDSTDRTAVIGGLAFRQDANGATTASAAGSKVGVEVEIVIPIIVEPRSIRHGAVSLSTMSAHRVIRTRRPWRARSTASNSSPIPVRIAGSITVRSLMGGRIATIPIESGTVLQSGRASLEARWRRTPRTGVYRWRTRLRTTAADGSPRSIAIRHGQQSGVLIVLPPWWWWFVAVTIVTVASEIQRRRRNREIDEVFDEFDLPSSDDG